MATYKSKYFTAEQIDEILNALHSHIKDVNGDVEIKAYDTENPARASIYVDQGQVFMRAAGGEVSVSNGKAMISGKYKSGSLPATLEFRENEAKFTGLHPQIEDRAVQNYDKDKNFLCTMKNVEQKFNNFYAIRSMSHPDDTSEKTGKIYNEIDSGSDGKNLEIVVYKPEGTDVAGHAPNSGVSRISMKNTGKMDLYADTQMWFRSPDVRYNPKNFASSQSIINRKYADSRFIYWCELYMTHFADYEAFNNWLSSATMSSEMPTLVLAKLDNEARVCVFLGEMVNGSFVESRLVYSLNYFLFWSVEDNESGIRDADGEAIESEKLYRFEHSMFEPDTYKTTLDIIPIYSNRTYALDKLAKGSGVLMGSIFWNVGMQSVDTRFVDLNNISAGEKRGGISIPNASSTTRGFMSSADKIKLDGINTDGSIYRGLFEAAGAVYNEETKFYELNGLTDITKEEMLKIYLYYSPKYFGSYSSAFSGINIRTCLKINLKRGVDISFFFENSTIEVVNIDNTGWYASNFNGAFSKARNLSKIMGAIYLSQIKSASSMNVNPFVECFALEDVKIHGLLINIYLGDSALISQESISYLVNNAANTSAITVQVHPDVYAKLTDSSNTDWYAVNTAAQAKQISFATTDAQAAAISLMNAEEPAIIQETRGELTEIAAPAGYYLTQEGDTDGRMYFTMKVLVEGDSLDNYRLATSMEYEAWKEENENNITN